MDILQWESLAWAQLNGPGRIAPQWGLEPGLWAHMGPGPKPKWIQVLGPMSQHGRGTWAQCIQMGLGTPMGPGPGPRAQMDPGYLLIHLGVDIVECESLLICSSLDIIFINADICYLRGPSTSLDMIISAGFVFR